MWFWRSRFTIKTRAGRTGPPSGGVPNAGVVEEADPSRHEPRIVLILERRVVRAGNQGRGQTELVLLASELPENLPCLVTDVVDSPGVRAEMST